MNIRNFLKTLVTVTLFSTMSKITGNDIPTNKPSLINLDEYTAVHDYEIKTDTYSHSFHNWSIQKLTYEEENRILKTFFENCKNPTIRYEGISYMKCVNGCLPDNVKRHIKIVS